ncbi:hypothetical protein PC116_g24200 [Phytophthora cactorum]|uniref:Uncharacterized protein n=1 Tax=Phytophthora cactorum TaxID=29920 RepID=A0A8T1BFS1_9STRA|nr:hypothetical protein PC114_g22137 [Phytophthora cactorum]KAG2900601.1 hypothetical protein PC117_g21944 [Phytophthora cactorum]KAG2998015.1 hypothetical protein PC120_g21218 [Phytophthora cactorum]KAG3133661.1 hypothetical protein C6341_g22449 [Phytophthora cactorum]KAG4227410.1 hypothetical protein PC116_g24200 [Phytophthora cactorum]
MRPRRAKYTGPADQQSLLGVAATATTASRGKSPPPVACGSSRLKLRAHRNWFNASTTSARGWRNSAWISPPECWLSFDRDCPGTCPLEALRASQTETQPTTTPSCSSPLQFAALILAQVALQSRRDTVLSDGLCR